MPDDALGRPFGVPARREPVLPNGVLGMLIFVATEVMFFSGLISAFVIGKSNAIGGWPPPGQPRLPVEETALNTAALLASGVALYFANRAFKNGSPNTKAPLAAGDRARWLFRRVSGRGVGCADRRGADAHLRAAGRLLLPPRRDSRASRRRGVHHLCSTPTAAHHGDLDRFTFWPAQIFWYFVVGVWPILYWQVYL